MSIWNDTDRTENTVSSNSLVFPEIYHRYVQILKTKAILLLYFNWNANPLQHSCGFWMKEGWRGDAVMMRPLCYFLPPSDIMSNCASRCIYTNVSTLYANFSLDSAVGRADHIRNTKNAAVYVKAERYLVPRVWCKCREYSYYSGLCVGNLSLV
jgi:hypothetical protein